MAENNDNLFNRLTKLFRSGPTVKRRVKDFTKTSKKASSAVELFKKAHTDVYNSTLSAYGSFDRMSRYGDFGEMESTPEIASALDIYAEETCSSDVDGKVLHIYSEDRQQKELLETLFYDTLNVNFNLVMWTRNLVKYGDFFLFNDVHPEFGVVNAYPITITEVEREEGFDKEDPSAVRFRWITQGNTILENWQVSHFRLLGNDAFLPYGSSVLESARRIWRQLILQEDAMLLYRVVRAPERRVFYIDVGNVPPDEIADYVEQAKSALKRSPVINSGTGGVDLRYNPMAVDEDYFIPVRGGDSGTRIDSLAGGANASAIEDVEYIQKKLFAALKIPKAYLGYDEEVGCLFGDTLVDLVDGRQVSMEQLVKEYEAGKENYCYSYTTDGQPKIGKISKAWKTKEVTEYYEVSLDNGKVIRCTGNHPFLLKSGEYVRADELESGQSLMAKYSKVSNRNIKGYEQVYNHKTEEYEFTHRIANEQGIIQIHESAGTEDFDVVHHIDFDKTNNHPNNLLLMGRKSHANYHSENGRNLLLKSSRDKLREKMKTEEYKMSHSSGVQKAWKNDGGTRSKQVSENNKKYKKMDLMQTKLAELRADGLITAKLSERPEISLVIDSMKRGNYTLSQVCSDIGFGPVLTKEVVETHYESWDNFVDKYDSQFSRKGRKLRNYDIIKAQELAAVCKTRQEFHKRNIVSRTAHSNALRKQGINPTDWYNEYIGTFNHKVISVLKIIVESPVPVYDIQVDEFHNFVIEESVVVHNSKATLAQEDIRFSRTIARIQKTIIAELNKIAMIHLYCHGYTEEQLLSFRLALSNPSSLAQSQKLDLIKSKFDIAGAAPEGMVSKNWIYRNIFGFTTDDIDSIKNDQLREKLADMELEAAGGGGDDAGGGDDGGGDLFAGDRPEGPVLTGITPQPGVNEYDDYGDSLIGEADELDEDEIDLARISAMAMDGIKPEAGKRNMWGELMKEPRKRDSKAQASTLEMPDFKSMVGHSRPQDTLNDPNQAGWLKSMGKASTNMFTKESRERRLAEYIAGLEPDKDPLPPTVVPSMSFQSRKMLERMSSKLGIGKILKEQNKESYSELLEEHYDFGLDMEIDDE